MLCSIFSILMSLTCVTTTANEPIFVLKDQDYVQYQSNINWSANLSTHNQQSFVFVFFAFIECYHKKINILWCLCSVPIVLQTNLCIFVYLICVTTNKERLCQITSQTFFQKKTKLWVKVRLHFLFISTLIGRRGRDRMVVGLITTYAITAYHH